MEYVLIQSADVIDEWRVEAIEEDGRIYVALFSGPSARARAQEYAAWKLFSNGDQWRSAAPTTLSD